MRSVWFARLVGAFFVGVGALYGCAPTTHTFENGAGAAGGAGGGVDTSVSSGGSGGGPSTGVGGDAGAGGGLMGSTGDCVLATDCDLGSACVEVTPGGFRVCTKPPTAVTMCSGDPADECCKTGECSAGTCLLAPLAPSCAGPEILPHNVCAKDQCAADVDCSSANDAICAIAGTMDRLVRSCVTAACHTNADCVAEAGGSCAPVGGTCCSNDGIVGLFCVYPSDGCRSDKECLAGYHCQIDAGRASCAADPAICP